MHGMRNRAIARILRGTHNQLSKMIASKKLKAPAIRYLSSCLRPPAGRGETPELKPLESRLNFAAAFPGQPESSKNKILTGLKIAHPEPPNFPTRILSEILFFGSKKKPNCPGPKSKSPPTCPPPSPPKAPKCPPETPKCPPKPPKCPPKPCPPRETPKCPPKPPKCPPKPCPPRETPKCPPEPPKCPPKPCPPRETPKCPPEPPKCPPKPCPPRETPKCPPKPPKCPPKPCPPRETPKCPPEPPKCPPKPCPPRETPKCPPEPPKCPPKPCPPRETPKCPPEPPKCPPKPCPPRETPKCPPEPPKCPPKPCPPRETPKCPPKPPKCPPKKSCLSMSEKTNVFLPVIEPRNSVEDFLGSASGSASKLPASIDDLNDRNIVSESEIECRAKKSKGKSGKASRKKPKGCGSTAGKKNSFKKPKKKEYAKPKKRDSRVKGISKGGGHVKPKQLCSPDVTEDNPNSGYF